MRGSPKRYSRKQDVLNGLAEYPEETKRYLQGLLDDRYCIVSSEELPEGEEGKHDPPLLRSYEMGSSDKEGKVLSRTVVQQVWKEDVNAALFRLGLTVEEAEKLIAG